MTTKHAPSRSTSYSSKTEQNGSDHQPSSQQTLASALHARRSEYTRPHTARIKIGTWNVAAKKGTELDVAGWFVGSKGIDENLSGLSLDTAHNKTSGDRNGPANENGGSGSGIAPDSEHTQNGEAAEDSHAPAPSVDEIYPTESVDDQEERRSKKSSTLPKNESTKLPHGSDIDLYVLGLQEVVDISSPTEALRPYSDPSTAKRWKKAMADALPEGYSLVAEQQLIGLLILTFASPPIRPHVRCVSSSTVACGVMGVIGNKGAVATRIVLGEDTRVAFLNAHMSAGVGKAELERRNWDANQILTRTKFDGVTDSLGYESQGMERVGDEDVAFMFGDLNYRLATMPGADVRRLLELHTRDEYDIERAGRKKVDDDLAKTTELVQSARSRSSTMSSTISKASTSDPRKSTDAQSTYSQETLDQLGEIADASYDPTSLQTTLNSLLPHDELRQQMEKKIVFHDGWKEGMITFLPSYKYDVGSVGLFDSGEKRRSPSWCDRILYRSKTNRLDYERKVLEEQQSKQRDERMKAEGVEQAADDEDTLFDYDPDADGDNDYDAGDTSSRLTKEASNNNQLDMEDENQDPVTLEYYLSHQRVLSSDHKPIDAVFKLRYDAAVPDLMAKVHSEVVRELDRAENEARPTITIVADGAASSSNSDFDGVHFGSVRYQEPEQRFVTIANNGGVDAYFGFIKRAVSMGQSPQVSASWISLQLDLEPQKTDDEARTFVLLPGDTCSMAVTVNIDGHELLTSVNNEEALEDVIVLRVANGRDYFLPVRASWMQSIYGRSVDWLTKVPDGGVRTLQSSDDRDTPLTVSETSVRSAPVEIFRMTETLESLVERIMAEWSILGEESRSSNRPSIAYAGWPFMSESWTSDLETRRNVRRCVEMNLEQHKPLANAWPEDSSQLARLEGTADVLLRLLRNLEDGIVTTDLWTALEKEFFTNSNNKTMQSNEDKRFAVLEILSRAKPHSVSFAIITSMLSRLAQEIGSHYESAPASARSSLEVPSSPTLKIKRNSLDLNPIIARRQLVCKNYAAIFADAMIRVPALNKGRLTKNTVDGNKRELIEIFLPLSAS